MKYSELVVTGPSGRQIHASLFTSSSMVLTLHMANARVLVKVEATTLLRAAQSLLLTPQSDSSDTQLSPFRVSIEAGA